jgi:hypothetical protein
VHSSVRRRRAPAAARIGILNNAMSVRCVRVHTDTECPGTAAAVDDYQRRRLTEFRPWKQVVWKYLSKTSNEHQISGRDARVHSYFPYPGQTLSRRAG